jgi:hypothetical protein
LDGGPVIKTFTTDASGLVEGDIVVLTTFDSHNLAAVGQISGATATAKIDPRATLSLSPSSGPVGTVVAIASGPGWMPGEVVHVIWNGNHVADTTADATGSVLTSLTIPKHAPGDVQIALTDDILLAKASRKFQVT